MHMHDSWFAWSFLPTNCWCPHAEQRKQMVMSGRDFFMQISDESKKWLRLVTRVIGWNLYQILCVCMCPPGERGKYELTICRYSWRLQGRISKSNNLVRCMTQSYNIWAYSYEPSSWGLSRQSYHLSTKKMCCQFPSSKLPRTERLLCKSAQGYMIFSWTTHRFYGYRLDLLLLRRIMASLHAVQPGE